MDNKELTIANNHLKEMARLLSGCFITSNSSGGKYWVEMKFDTMEDKHDFYVAVLQIVAKYGGKE